MKRVFSLILALAMMLSITACGAPAEEAPAQSQTVLSAEQKADTPAETGVSPDVENLSNAPEQTEEIAPEQTEESGDKPTEPQKEESGDKPTEPEKEVSGDKPTEPEKEESKDKPTEPEKEESKDKPTEPKNEESKDKPTEPKNEESGDKPTEPGTEESGDEPSEPEEDPAPVVEPASEYNRGVVLVKVVDTFRPEDLGTLEYVSAEALYKGSKWYAVVLADPDKTVEAVSYLTGLGTFDSVDYDYIMATDADDAQDVTDNPDYALQTNLNLHKIPEAWAQNSDHPGGSPDVIVAVIDTGVDYNHLDLHNNIWTNTGEIAGNGIDDDGNGYIDDIHGWDCVGDDKDPMDDNGHGTHVAGIIAAENNQLGGVGVAYNCKIMVLKAGNSSGYFNNSDVAEAIQYAYMNGASVINMSFGGSSISLVVEEALENAYGSCVLVAAAGNDSACNNLGCLKCMLRMVTYPAALPYVIGVMSTDANGQKISSFSNYDHYPYGTVEYEVYAVGEAVKSTWPGNKYTALNGTSMAAPTVSGIAALLRSKFSDRAVYSTKYIQSQIVNTGTVTLDGAHCVVDAYEAMTRFPTPAVNLYDYYIFDNTEFSDANNGDGIIDAGETIYLAVELYNRGGVASDVVVTADTVRNDDFSVQDPYFTIVNESITLGDIGTYSVRDCGKVYSGKNVTRTEKYFEIVVSEDCPNAYKADFNIRYTYGNGLDENDAAEYSGAGVAQLSVSSGVKLPAVFSEDTTLTAGKRYIVSQDVYIPTGITVNVEAGAEIQFYENSDVYYNSVYNSPTIKVDGELNFNGTADNMIRIYPSELFADYFCLITKANFRYTHAVNLGGSVDYASVGDSSYTADHCSFVSSTDDYRYIISGGETRAYYGEELSFVRIENSYIGIPSVAGTSHPSYVRAETAENCCFDLRFGRGHYVHHIYIDNGSNNLFVTTRTNNSNLENSVISVGEARNNVFMTSNNSNVAKDCATLRIDDPSNTILDAYGIFYETVIYGYYTTNGDGTPLFDIHDKTDTDLTKIWPFVTDVTLTNADGEEIRTVGFEPFSIRVEFNRPVSAASEMITQFGSVEPFADYSVEGMFAGDTAWEGLYTLKAFIENGRQFFSFRNVAAKDDPFLELANNRGYYSFTIDTTAAMAMNLQAVPQDNGIELTWNQDEYDTLLGYNIYRSEDKDGNFVRLNPTIIMPEENTFLDENAEPGKTYWYTYTVVLSDFTESNPAGKVQASAKDTMAPSIYHTPVNQGYENNNLVISCTASDNVGIQSAVLYYRTVGEESWKNLTMSRQNNKYSATIFGSEVTLAGIQYYIVANDGVNTVSKGSAETPYTVVVKAASSLLGKGDVDGNGSVTTKDALMLMQCLNGDLLLSDDAFKRADLNGDTVLSAAEALRILQYVNGKVKDLEM